MNVSAVGSQYLDKAASAYKSITDKNIKKNKVNSSHYTNDASQAI
jgi:hypothetical protein